MQHRNPHILNASTNLLGICLVVIGGLRFSHSDVGSLADEVAWLATFSLLVSTVSSYLALRSERAANWQTRLADISFLAGLAMLVIAVGVFVVGF